MPIILYTTVIIVYLKMKISSFIVNNNNSFATDQVASRNVSPFPPENPLDNFSGNPSRISQHTISVNPVSTYTPSGRVAEISFWKAPTQNTSALPKRDVDDSGQTGEVDRGDGRNESEKTAREGERDKQGKLGVSELAKQEKAEVRELQNTDRKVRMHEMAHMAAGGQYTGSARYSYKTGPDGRHYAVGGSVPIDASKEASTEKTVQKMAQVKRAALAPADPSAADREIAAKAAQMMAQARLEMIQQQMEEREEGTEAASPGKIAYCIKSYEKNGELIDRNGGQNEAIPAGQSGVAAGGGIETLKSDQIQGETIDLFS